MHEAEQRTKDSLQYPETPSPVQVLRAGRGFSCVFWGLPISILLMSGMLKVRPSEGFRLPTYVLGVAILYLGALHFCRAGNVTRRWRALCGRYLLLIFLMFYLAPFVYWWMRAPYRSFYLANVLGLAGAAVASLYLVNRLASHVGEAIRDDTFQVEARLTGWSVLLLTAFPMACVLLYAAQAMFRFDSSLYSELAHVHYQTPRWMIITSLLPVGLTMLIAWKAKECCFHYVGRLSAAGRAGEKAEG